MTTESSKSYRTHQIRIKKGHRMYTYFNTMNHNANNLYNTTNFYIRQIHTTLTQDKPLQSLQIEVMQTIDRALDRMNTTQLATYQKKKQKELSKPTEERTEIKANLFTRPTKETPFVSYNFLDCLFKVIKQKDYTSLPGQVNQQVMKFCFQDWKSFFASLKEYKKHPEKFKGRPRIPGYQTKGGVKEATFSNQICKIKDGKYLRFPLTKLQLNIGKLGLSEGKFQQVRIIPSYNEVIVELIFLVGEEKEVKAKKENSLAIDLGLDNLVTAVTNTGIAPVIFKGGRVKAINQLYNKLHAYYFAVLRNGKRPTEGNFQSRKLSSLSKNRHTQLKDFFHKVSYQLVQLAINENIDTIVIGKNDNWKQDVRLGKKNNQNFVSIPYSLLIQMITYKACAEGIAVIVNEESYTSKASFLDEDVIPTFVAGDEKTYSFSGKRVQRGLYVAKDGKKINADVNGAANILRKVVPQAFFAKGVAAVCSQPRVVNVL